jgi:hypothetical protein
MEKRGNGKREGKGKEGKGREREKGGKREKREREKREKGKEGGKERKEKRGETEGEILLSKTANSKTSATNASMTVDSDVASFL